MKAIAALLPTLAISYRKGVQVIRLGRFICPTLRLTVLLLFLSPYIFSVQQEKGKDPDFPKNEEIQLVVSQAERALDLYKQAVDLEETFPVSKDQKTAIDRDREVIVTAKKLTGALKSNPNGFHGVGGLLLLSTLDDASRNAALCSAQAMSENASVMMAKPDLAKAYELLHISQTCTDVSTHLYTVSESVQALLVRDMEGQQILSDKMFKMVNDCNAALKPKNK